MKLRLIGFSDRYALEQQQLSLFPDEPVEEADAPFSGDGATVRLSKGKTYLTATARIRYHGKEAFAVRRLPLAQADVRMTRRTAQLAYFKAASAVMEEAPEWGSLSGVRPTKLSTAHLLSGGTRRSAERLMEKTFFVSPARSRLCVDASLATVAAQRLLAEHDLSVYIGIPFCPTRCAYCSFVSQSIERFSGLLEPYVDALIREIEHTGDCLRSSPFRIRTLYMGGGTPTTLSAAQLARLMEAIARNFDLTALIEYTVEGGRPDTLDAEKLRVLRAHGCDRISINPQSMNDEVLAAIGRRHTAAQTTQAYFAARDAGFSVINMDLIAGLPRECAESFARSLDAVRALAPENITVHTLAMKKGADLFFHRLGLPQKQEVAEMLTYAQTRLRGDGFAPYYLYRQKYMSGSFENVGWQKGDTPCLYNIYMMEELHSILSLGGGGVSKLNLPGGKIERLANPKYPTQYIERIDDVCAKKDEFFTRLMEGD